MSSSLQSIYKKLNSGFFAFWVVNRKVSILFSLLIFFLGVFSIYQIPKESSPEIDFGIVNIVTIYPGVSPVDMDDLITQKIEDAIKDIEGIDVIQSSSRVGVASTTITLENGIDVTDFINEARTEIDAIRLPVDAENPIVTEISPAEDVVFQAILYADETLFPKEALIESARELTNELEVESYISAIDVKGGIDYDLEVLIDKQQTEQLNLSINTIAQTIRAYNQNTPIGNYEVDTFNYDFRIQGELETIQDLLAIPIRTQGFTTITLGDVSEIRRNYDNERISRLGKYQQQGFNAITVDISKADSISIFDAASSAKQRIEELLTQQAFEGIQVAYANDLANQIQKDYDTLFNSSIQTFVFVFLCLLLFVGVKEALVANLGILLAFCVTFIVLNQLGYTLNFLTNFSLILTLGIAIDTSIVVIEAAYERMRLGFSPKTASLLAVRDFKAPLIAGTSTTLVVFIPMMVLPGVLGKFLAYIPITVFITLVAALFVALTINVAWFYKLSKEKKYYIGSESLEQFLSESDKKILEYERQGKEIKQEDTLSFRERALEGLNNRYERFLRRYLPNKFMRWTSVITPFVLMIVSTVVLGPILGFTLFPAGDNDRLDLSITAPVGQTVEVTSKRVPYLEPNLSQYEEIKQYDVTVNQNEISIGIELLEKDERDARGLMNVFELEQSLSDTFQFLIQEGLEYESKALAGGPPSDKPVAIKLVAQRGDQFAQLLEVAAQFEDYLKGVEGTKNVGISSQRTPGQFIYEFDNDILSRLGITPSQAAGSIASSLNGLSAGAITIDQEERTIKVLLDEFADTVTPSDIGNIVVQTPSGPVTANEFISYRIDNAVAEISREDQNITVTIQSDLSPERIAQAGVINQELVERAQIQTLPQGITYEKSGETQENADLINAAAQGLVIAIFLIFVILVLQFNSFTRPMVILYSVICALLGVNIGLWVTGNPYSMSMGIGFIALTGIVVNDAIVLLDRIQENVKHGASQFEAIVEAGRSRLQPIILTTLTTLLGILPISLQDEFWAGLGYTLIFGLFAGSAMTLFVIPSLYSIFFLKNVELPKK